MRGFDRITFDPQVMGGHTCLRRFRSGFTSRLLRNKTRAGMVWTLLVICEQCKTVVRQHKTASALQLPLRFFYGVLRLCVATRFEPLP
jgi:hypothetical protein